MSKFCINVKTPVFPDVVFGVKMCETMEEAKKALNIIKTKEDKNYRIIKETEISIEVELDEGVRAEWYISEV